MTNARSFGRRATTQPPPPRLVKAPAEAAPPKFEAVVTPDEQFSAAVESEASLPMDIDPSVEDELREWKEARRRKIPWRQISLMASLSFGIGSFVLTGEVADAVNWLLYALSAASLYFWWTGRGAKTKA